MNTPHECWIAAGGDAARYKELLIEHGHLVPKAHAPWFNGEALLFDLETTAPEPMDARMVTATCVEVNAKGIVQTREWLINAGVDIPAEATAIHGVSTAKVQAEGQPIADALGSILNMIEEGWARGLPLVAFNANYDLTVVEAELHRQQPAAQGQILLVGPILDPFVIDRACDPYRKGKRTLVPTAAHYGVKQDNAHSSTGDALCAGRIVWAQSKLAMKRGPYAQLRKLSLDQMQEWQAKAHFERQTNYEEYLAKKGTPQRIEKSWPLRKERD